MTVMEFFGCAFLAFGPPLALFCLTIANDPIKIIILIASAFFWLISLLLSSLLWRLLKLGLGDTLLIISVCCSVFLQELLRYVVYLLLRKAEVGLEKVTENGSKLIDNKYILAYVAGLGFGIMSGAFALINVLADSVGPGTLGIHGSSQGSFFFVSTSLTTLCFIFLHMAWGVIFFHGLDNSNYFLIAFVPFSHLCCSCLTFLNSRGDYYASILPNYVILAVVLWIAFHLAGGRFFKGTSSSPPTSTRSRISTPEPRTVAT